VVEEEDSIEARATLRFVAYMLRKLKEQASRQLQWRQYQTYITLFVLAFSESGHEKLFRTVKHSFFSVSFYKNQFSKDHKKPKST
jgi:hypothetical protein